MLIKKKFKMRKFYSVIPPLFPSNKILYKIKNCVKLESDILGDAVRTNII